MNRERTEELAAKGPGAAPKSAWHKVECADDFPPEEGKEYLLRLKSRNGVYYVFEELFFNEADDVFFFDNYDWHDIDAWCDPEEIV